MSAEYASRADVLGCQLDRLDMGQTLERCEELIVGGGPAQHMAVNAAKIIAAREDPELRELINRCALVTADGQSVVWASRLLGDAVPTRVAGIDLMNELFALAARRGYRVFVLGARREVLDEALRRVQRQHPQLTIAGSRDGYFSEAEEPEVAAEIGDAAPDILFVAISSPRKEYFLGRWGQEMGVPFAMGVGGAIDVVAGLTRRAPGPLQRLGLEWAYRLYQEPRRLFRRYLVTNTRFISATLREVLRGRFAKAS